MPEYLSQKCPECESEGMMYKDGRFLVCDECGYEWEIDSQNVPTGSADINPLLGAELSDEQYKVIYTQIYTIINYWKHTSDLDEMKIRFGKAMVDVVKNHLAKLDI